MGLPCTMVKESKKGNLPEGTITALGIGPAPNSKVSPITSDLKLL
ncbi:MAG: peptidyl-tRNA hydrolase [Candidatus Heimdallarchaeota archaeon]